MKINEHWILEKVSSDHTRKEVQSRLDILDTRFRHSVPDKYAIDRSWRDDFTIIHYPKIPSFTPIVLTKTHVVSKCAYTPKRFIRAIEDILRGKEGRYLGWLAQVDESHIVSWDCREFTRSQLILIRKTIKWHFDL